MTTPLGHGQPAERPAREPTDFFPVALLAIVLALWGVLVYNVWTLDPVACSSVDSQVPGIRFVAAGISGLLIGRYSGALRFVQGWQAEDTQDKMGKSAEAGRKALAVIFLALVPIFIYEAIGVYEPSNGLEPITYYVRCSIWLDDHFGGGIRTFLIILFISFLFGHWLWAWHPVTNQYRGRLVSGTGELVNELANKKLSELPRRRIPQSGQSFESGGSDAKLGANSPGA